MVRTDEGDSDAQAGEDLPERKKGLYLYEELKNGHEAGTSAFHMEKQDNIIREGVEPMEGYSSSWCRFIMNANSSISY